jgi:hypothetical protein
MEKMSNPTTNTDKSLDRANIIQTIQTPLGFFALVVLTVEVIFGIVAAMSAGSDRTYLIVGMLLIIFLLIIIVASLSVWRPESLSGQRPSYNSNFVGDISPILKIKSPKVLCASTTQFEVLGFEEDIKTLKTYFKNTEVKHSLTSNDFNTLLSIKKYDIIHLLAYVEPGSGNIIFSENDSLTSLGFSKLVEISKAQLVVLATCDSIDLAARVARTTNIVGSTTIMQTKDFINWANSFYRLLSRNYALSQAYDTAASTNHAPVVLLMKQDIMFG